MLRGRFPDVTVEKGGTWEVARIGELVALRTRWAPGEGEDRKLARIGISIRHMTRRQTSACWVAGMGRNQVRLRYGSGWMQNSSKIYQFRFDFFIK